MSATIDETTGDEPTDDEPTDDEPAVAASEPVARLQHPRPIRWMHWLNVPIFAVMVWSGLRIYWAEDVYAFGIGSWQWFAFFPDQVYETLGLERRLARGMAFHFTFGWLFVANGLAYLLYSTRKREWRHILPDRWTAREAPQVVLHDLHVRKEAPPQGKYNAAQRISYTAAIAMSVIVVVSGFAIYKPTALHPLPWLFGGYQGARLTHFAMTIGLLLFVVVHLIQVARAGWGNARSMVTGYVIEHPEPAEVPSAITARGDQAEANR